MAKALASQAEDDDLTLTASDIATLCNAVSLGRADALASVLMDLPLMKSAILKRMATDIELSVDSLKGRKSNTSVLMNKDFTFLKTMKFSAIVQEFSTKFPQLFQLIHGLIVPQKQQGSPVHQEKVMPRLAMVYGLLMFTRNQELSLLQRVMAMCLRNNLCDQKVKKNMLVFIESPYI